MKEVILNPEKLSDNEIDTTITRVKAVMINSNDEILLGYCDGIYQFPGGHVEDNEAFEVAVNREIEEETGIRLDVQNPEPFYCIKYYKKNFKDTGSNRLSQLYYFYIKTDKAVNTDNIKYTDREKRGGFKLEYIKIDKLKDTLINNIPNSKYNVTIVKEMLAVMEEVSNKYL